MTGGWYSVQSKSHKMSLDCKILEIGELFIVLLTHITGTLWQINTLLHHAVWGLILCYQQFEIFITILEEGLLKIDAIVEYNVGVHTWVSCTGWYNLFGSSHLYRTYRQKFAECHLRWLILGSNNDVTLWPIHLC